MSNRVGVVGSRKFVDYGLLCAVLDTYRLEVAKISLIVSGGARGADYLAERYAKDNGIPLLVYPVGSSPTAEFGWTTHGKRAGAVRNKLIVDAVDELVAFPSFGGVGTQITVEMARKAGKQTYVYYMDEES